MKKIFAFVATALVAFGFTACKQNPDEPKKDSIKVEMSEGLIFDDQTADPEQGWWQVYGSTEEFLISLSNAGTVTQVEGVYEATAFDVDYTFYATATDTVQFTAGSIKVSKLAADEYTFVGNLDGNNGKTYYINLHYTAPQAKKTVEINCVNAMLDDETYALYGLFGLTGANEDQSAGMSLLIAQKSAELAGTYTEEDIWTNYSYVYDNGYQNIYTATIVIAEAYDHYDVTAEILCYNNTLYKLTLKPEREVVVPPTGEEVELGELEAVFIDDYRDFDGSYMLYLQDNPESPTMQLVLNLFDEDFAGTFTVEDIDLNYSNYVTTEKKQGLQDIAVTAELSADSLCSTYAGYVIANDGIQYNFNSFVKVDSLLNLKTNAPARMSMKKAKSEFKALPLKGAKFISK